MCLSRKGSNTQFPVILWTSARLAAFGNSLLVSCSLIKTLSNYKGQYSSIWHLRSQPQGHTLLIPRELLWAGCPYGWWGPGILLAVPCFLNRSANKTNWFRHIFNFALPNKTDELYKGLGPPCLPVSQVRNLWFIVHSLREPKNGGFIGSK